MSITGKEIVRRFNEEMKKEEANNIRPNHYKTGDIECIDYIKDVMSSESYKGFLHGNIIKYISRYENKNGVEDLKKAKVYLDWLIAELEE